MWYPALSITWLVLVIPATFAEVIGLSLRNPGTFGYRDVQLFTGFIYIGAFIFGWILRAWKVHDLERTRLENAQREIAAVSAREEGVLPSTTTTTATATATTTELRRHASHSSSVKEKFMSLRGLWAIQRV
ncbi:hypothetical protein GGR50DRAFT_697447 [Xylaria sp. CBS 124048]|nr:hypothetical protein GGR50DRAFT_697447 [Xylaria sp. CBS 124048]